MKLTCGLLFLAMNLAAQTALPTVTALRNFSNGIPLSPTAYGFLYGANFGSSPKVFLGGTQCQLFAITDTFLSFQVPADSPTGPSILTVQTAAGTSAPYSFTLSPTSPVIVLNDGKPPFSYFFDVTSIFIPLPTPSAGDRVYFYVDGVGPFRPPVPPEIQIDGNDVPVLAASTFNALIGGPALGPLPVFQIQIPSLPSGPHIMRAIAGNATSPDITFTVINRGLFTSHTGLTFNALQGGPAIPNQSFSVLSGSGTINFSLTTTTVSGGTWLSATPVSGTSAVLTAGVPIQVQANPSGLAIGTYYGSVSIASPDVSNSPQAVTVVLNVSAKAAPSISKTGAIFVGTIGGGNPAAQTISAFNPTVGTISYTSSLQGAGATLFKVTPATGNILSGQSQAISIQASTASVPAGVYPAKLTLSFSDGTIRTVTLLLIETAATGGVASPERRDATSCVATKLLPVFSLVGDSFSVPAAWPTAVEATIADDCGNPMNTGTVVLSFSNGDAPLRLDPNLGGVWSGTWPPANPRASGVVLTLVASQPETKLAGSAQISGGVSANPAVPQVSAGGVVDAAAYRSPVAPGGLVAIFGAELSSAVSQVPVPFPNKVLDTAVLLDGQFIPLYFASGGQVNAMIPYGLPINSTHQLVLQRGNSLSVPQSVVIGVARPGVLTPDSSGAGQGHIYKVDAAGNQILADNNAPAKAGDTLVIYCTGFGAVNPPLTAGAITPFTFLTSTVDTLTAMIGGKPAAVGFAGLTPGFAGLYQVNAVVPAGLPNSDATTLQLTISGQESPSVTLSVHQ